MFSLSDAAAVMRARPVQSVDANVSVLDKLTEHEMRVLLAALNTIEQADDGGAVRCAKLSGVAPERAAFANSEAIRPGIPI
jgi:hypothetical protein